MYNFILVLNILKPLNYQDSDNWIEKCFFNTSAAEALFTEKGIPGVEAAGEWYGNADGEACPTQTLLCTDNLSACGIRLWRLTD